MEEFKEKGKGACHLTGRRETLLFSETISIYAEERTEGGRECDDNKGYFLHASEFLFM